MKRKAEASTEHKHHAYIAFSLLFPAQNTFCLAAPRALLGPGLTLRLTAASGACQLVVSTGSMQFRLAINVIPTAAMPLTLRHPTQEFSDRIYKIK